MNNYFLQLKKDIPNDIGWIRRILSYAFDWYIGGMIASLPVIVIYMMLHQDATYIPQNLSIFHAPYNIIAGSLSFIVASGYYVLVPMFVFKGQTLGKKIFHLHPIAYSKQFTCIIGIKHQCILGINDFRYTDANNTKRYRGKKNCERNHTFIYFKLESQVTSAHYIQ